VYGVRDPASDKHAALKGPNVDVRSVREAVEAADLVILATPWNAAQGALEAAGDFAQKTLIDATNPIGPGFALTHGHTDSGAEQVARWAKNARVVKAFNTTGAENMADPAYGDARVAMFVCGDDEAACSAAEGLAKDLGFDPLVVGGLTKARAARADGDGLDHPGHGEGPRPWYRLRGCSGGTRSPERQRQRTPRSSRCGP
jgi:predicted dinucleotide-binding enzyme